MIYVLLFFIPLHLMACETCEMLKQAIDEEVIDLEHEYWRYVESSRHPYYIRGRLDMALKIQDMLDFDEKQAE